MKNSIFFRWFCFLLPLFLLFVTCQKKGTDPDSDQTPPEIVSVFPEENAQAVNIRTFLQIIFDESIQPSSVEFDLKNFNTGRPVSGVKTVEENKVTFQPVSILSYSTTYRATVKAGVRDKAGNAMKQDYSWSFTTEKAPAVPDTIPPQVISTIPADGSTDAPPTIQIKVVFSEKVNVPQSAFSLKDENGASVSGSRSVSGSTFTFIPQNPLVYNATYTATVTTAVTDLAGNHLAQNYSFSFTVKPDDIAPQVVETHPADGDTGVAKDTDIWVKFDELIDPASVNATTFAVSGPNGNVSGNYFVNNDTARFVPDSLDWETTYTVTLSGITDLAGNPMSDYTFSFTTQADTTPRWVADSPTLERIAITDNGTVYTVGGGGVVVVRKFSPEGKVLWKIWLPNYAYYSRDIAVYSGNGQDEVYVLTAVPNQFGGPGNVTKLDGDGNILWTSQDFSFMPRKIEVGEDGRVFVPEGALFEFDTNTGDILHVQNVGSNATGITDVVAFSDYIYVCGETYDDLFAQNVMRDWFVVKYDANYNSIFGFQYTTPDSVEDYFPEIAVDRTNNIIYVGGGYGISMNWIKDGISAFDGSSGNFLWFIEVDNGTGYIATPVSILERYNSSVYYGNKERGPAPIRIATSGNVEFSISSSGISDIDFYNGKMYVLFPYPHSNKIFLFDAETGVPLN